MIFMLIQGAFDHSSGPFKPLEGAQVTRQQTVFPIFDTGILFMRLAFFEKMLYEANLFIS